MDGYNFYYGLRNGGSRWKRTYWLDIVKFFEKMMLPDQELVEVNYYSARPIIKSLGQVLGYDDCYDSGTCPHDCN